MIKDTKYSLVTNLIERYNECSYIFLFDFTGVNVSQINKLRASYSSKAKASVIKNTLNKISTKKKFNNIHPFLSGQILSISTSDPVFTSKALSKFVKDNNVGKIIGCSDDKTFYNESDVQKFASLPSESEMKAKLLGTISGVPSKLLMSLNAVQTNTLRLIKQKYSS